MSKTFSTQARYLTPLLLPLVTVALMARCAALDPGPTGLPGDLPYGHNMSGDLRVFVRMVLVETLVIYLILRPWSYRRNRGRAIAALLFALPWTCFFFILMMHSGGIMVLHFLWLVAVCGSLGVLTERSGLSDTARQSAASDAVF